MPALFVVRYQRSADGTVNGGCTISFIKKFPLTFWNFVAYIFFLLISSLHYHFYTCIAALDVFLISFICVEYPI